MTCPVCGHRSDMKGRSLDQHRRFYGLVSAAYHQWPEGHDFQPESSEHLRKYLICAAGWYDATDIPVAFAEDQPSVTRLAAMTIEQAIRAAGTYAFVRTDENGGRVRVYRAKSIKFAKMPHKEFCALSNVVDDIVEDIFGCSANELLKKTEAAA